MVVVHRLVLVCLALGLAAACGADDAGKGGGGLLDGGDEDGGTPTEDVPGAQDVASGDATPDTGELDTGEAPTPDVGSGEPDAAGGADAADDADGDAAADDACPPEGCAEDNLPPVADAGPDQVVAERTLVELDGSRSSDADGDELTWSWRIVDLPGGSGAVLAEEDTEAPSFTADLPGTYRISLTVADPWISSEPSTVTVTAQDVPDRPVAAIAPLEAVPVGGQLVLDGSGSSDPDGDDLLYTWELTGRPEGSAAEVLDAAAAVTGVVPDVAGRYQVTLVVSDGELESARQSAEVHTLTGAPVADAGVDQVVAVGARATLDGAGSRDPDDDPLTWAWTPVALAPGSAAALDDAGAAQPSFVVDEPGAYVFSLTVRDPGGRSATDEVTVRSENRPPVADAGGDQAVELDTAVWLDGRGSQDPDGDAITYSWRLAARPEGSDAVLSALDRSRVWFSGDVAGSFVAELVVSDDHLDSEPAQVTVRVNAPPIADAGEDQEGVAAGYAVMLDGTGSSDPDGFPEPLSFVWRLDAKPGASGLSSNSILDRFAAVTSFVPDAAGLYRLTLGCRCPGRRCACAPCARRT